MFLSYVLSFFKKGDTIQGGTLFNGENYLRKYGNLVDKLADHNEEADLTKESKQSLR